MTTTPTEDTRLKPCIVCGGQPIIGFVSGSNGVTEQGLFNTISCSGNRDKMQHEISTGNYSKEEAIKQWNSAGLIYKNKAFNDLLVGGNHLASALLQVGFPDKIKNYDEALEKYKQPFADMWVAWKAIMELSKKSHIQSEPDRWAAENPEAWQAIREGRTLWTIKHITARPGGGYDVEYEALSTTFFKRDG